MRHALRLYTTSLKRALRPPFLWSTHSTMAGLSVLLGVATLMRVARLVVDPSTRSAIASFGLLVLFIGQSVVFVVAIQSSGLNDYQRGDDQDER